MGEAKKITKNDKKLQQNFEKATQSLFEPVGISFGQEENYKINATMKLLAEQHRAVSMRFWGKIMGKNSDYYVIQGISNKNKEPIVHGST